MLQLFAAHPQLEAGSTPESNHFWPTAEVVVQQQQQQPVGI